MTTHRVCDNVGLASGGAYEFTPLPLRLLLHPLSIWYPWQYGSCDMVMADHPGLSEIPRIGARQIRHSSGCCKV
jgi:hypothetical protein